MIPTLLFSALLFAPPAKAAPDSGRITLCVGEKPVHFSPDGGDVISFTLPDRINPSTGLLLAPDRKFVVHLDRSGTTAKLVKSKLVFTPLAGEAKPYVLDGYVANQSFLSADGSKVYFIGAKGEELETNKLGTAGAFALDLAMKKVTPIPLPERHSLNAVSPDGKTFLTTRIEAVNNTFTRKMYLVPPDGMSVEISKENLFVTMASFSPDGSKILAQIIESANTQPAAKGQILVNGAQPREYLVLDVKTNKTNPLREVPKKGQLSGLVWSPDGTQVAYVWYDRQAAIAPAVPPAGGVVRPAYEYKVFVADADGGNPKEVYKTKGSSFRAFMWK